MKQALVIIDVQKDYFENGKMELPHSNKILKNILEIRKSFLAKAEPVIYIKQGSNEELGFLIKDTEGAEFHEEIFPKGENNEYIVDKTTPNSFHQTNLEKILVQNQVEQVVIVGMMTHVCVDSTTRRASELGYNPIVIADACCGPNVSFNGQSLDSDALNIAFMAALENFAQVKVSYFN